MTKVKSNNILLYYYVLGRESADLYYTSSVVSTTLARTHFLVLFFASGNDDDINDVACMAGVNLQVRRGKSRSTLCRGFFLWYTPSLIILVFKISFRRKSSLKFSQRTQKSWTYSFEVVRMRSFWITRFCKSKSKILVSLQLCIKAESN